MVTAKREPAQEEPKLSKIPPWGPLRGPQGGVLDSFGFFLGRLPFGGGHLLTISLPLIYHFFEGAQNHFFTFFGQIYHFPGIPFLLSLEYHGRSPVF